MSGRLDQYLVKNVSIMMSEQLKIVAWNANGLCNHVLELKYFILTNDVDIMLISETHFTHKSFIRVPNYVIYNTRHPSGRGRGGTAIILKKNIKHVLKERYRHEHMQATSVEVWCWGSPLVLSSIYCPPNHSIKSEQFQEFFDTLGPKFIALGDWNAKHFQWGSRLISPRGRELFRAMQRKNYNHLSTGEPTYWPSDPDKVPDLIDFGVTHGVNSGLCRMSSSLDLSSDHTPIVLDLLTHIKEYQRNCVLYNSRTNWITFRDVLDDLIEVPHSINSRDGLDEAVAQITSAIQTAAWSATPAIVTQRGKNDGPPNIKEMVRENRRLKAVWKSTRHPDDKTRLNRASKQLKRILEKVRDDSVNKYLEELSPTAATDYSLWRATRKCNRPQLTNPPIKNSSGEWARSDGDKAEAFAQHLQQVFQPWPAAGGRDSDDLTSAEDQEPREESVRRQIKHFTQREILHVLQHEIHPRKAPGYDLVTGKVLMEVSGLCISYFQKIFNAILDLGYFPECWKVAEIIMIAKPGKDSGLVQSYRPISLLPTLSKVFEKLYMKRLGVLINKLNLIPDHQFGFRQGYGTVEQIHRVVDTIQNAFEAKQYCSAVFIDISQAFDRVWHEGLLKKIRGLLPVEHCDILESFVTDRHFYVKQRDEQSHLCPVAAGVPQGSVFGPPLFKLFASDLPTTSSTTTATFADDTAILATGDTPESAARKLQSSLASVEQWLQKWRIKANEDKSVNVLFTLRKGSSPPVTLNGKPIPQSDVAKYLGLHLDKRLTWKHHIWQKRKQLSMKFRTMLWLIHKNSKLRMDNKLLIYKSILKPVWTYGCPLWGVAAKSNIDIIQRFQNKVLRYITGAPWYVPNYLLHSDLEIPTVYEEILSMSKKYKERLLLHQSESAGMLAMDTGDLRRLSKPKPCDLFNCQ